MSFQISKLKVRSKLRGIEPGAIKTAASRREFYTFLFALPKGGDLHHHLGGATRPEAWFKIATDPSRNGNQRFFTRYRILNCEDSFGDRVFGRFKNDYWITVRESAWRRLPVCNKREFKPLQELSENEYESWSSSFVLDKLGEGRDEFFGNIWARVNHLLNDPFVMSEVLVDSMHRFGAEGVRYLEPQIAGISTFVDRSEKPYTPDEVYNILERRLDQTDALETGVTVRFQLMVQRFFPGAEEAIRKTFALIDSHRERWRGINMAGREDNEKGHPRQFTEVYDEMLRRYPEVGIAIHGGEQDKPSRHIFDTLRLGATRIGHGVNLIDDAPTMQLLRCGRFLVEINLVSNHLLEYVPNLSRHPFPIYLRQGIPCCLNTDDPGMWQSNMTDEYFVAVSNFNLNWVEIVQLGRNSIEFSFAQPNVRTRLLQDYERELKEFENRFLGNWRGELARANPEFTEYGKKHLDLGIRG